MVSTEFLITSLVLVLMPGTGVLYTVSTGLFQGARASLFAALGCTLGILPSLLASVFGLALIMHTSALAFQVVKVAGVIYLLYLAWAMWRESGGLSLEGQKETISGVRVAMRGFLMNILNPKLTLFFLAFLPQFLPAGASATVLELSVLGGIFMAMTLVVFCLYGLCAHGVRDYLVRSERAARYMQKIFAGSFAVLGVKLAFTER